jgi:hypothetical protein
VAVVHDGQKAVFNLRASTRSEEFAAVETILQAQGPA